MPHHGFRPCVAQTHGEALALGREWHFDAALVDADGCGLHPDDGVRGLRSLASMPVILLTSDPNDSELRDHLEAGAVDVMHVSASARLLCAKLRRFIASGKGSKTDLRRISVGPLAMDGRRGTAQVDGRPLTLTPFEFEVLYAMAMQPGRLVHRRALAKETRSPVMASGRSADVHVHRIRSKLRDIGATSLRVDTIHGCGYTLCVNAGAEPADPGKPLA